LKDTVKRKSLIFISSDGNFYSLPGYGISKYFSDNFSQSYSNKAPFFENVREKYFEIS